jgi:hypothetical protein
MKKYLLIFIFIYMSVMLAGCGKDYEAAPLHFSGPQCKDIEPCFDKSWVLYPSMSEHDVKWREFRLNLYCMDPTYRVCDDTDR